MKKTVLIILMIITQQFFITNIFASSNQSITITGTVTNQKGEPLIYANVYFPDDLSGDVTDKNGHFEISTQRTGKRELVVTFIGYQRYIQTIDIRPGIPDSLMIRMKEQPIKTTKVVVTASSFTLSEEEGTTLSALDVVSTAGAAADIMRAIQTFSGVTSIDEGAGLFVRGGDVSETRVLLDMGTLRHPYRYESPTGGYFGTFDPFLLSGTFFASGGFSAKYGNALSGVLAMESLGMAKKREFNLGIGLAAVSGKVSLPLVKDKLGVRFSGNKTSTDLMFQLNGNKGQFSQTPSSEDANISLQYRYSNNGSLKAFFYTSTDRIGVEAITPTYQGYYLGQDKNQYDVLKLKQPLKPSILMEITLSSNRFLKDMTLGCIDLQSNDQSLNSRIDFYLTPTSRMKINSGFGMNRLKSNYHGKIPYDPNDIEGLGKVLTYSETTTSDFFGGYIESEIGFSRIIHLKSGLRFDVQYEKHRTTLDPRISLLLQLNRHHSLRFATGIYHQFPDPYYTDKENGNPTLESMKSIHMIAGWEYGEGPLLIRIEGYVKSYINLILNDENLVYTNEGTGYSKGLDLFMKNDAGIFTGWIAYSLLQARRKEKFYNQKQVPTDYDITHNLKMAWKADITPSWGISITYRIATGRPYHTGYGLWNQGRTPLYQKTDLTFARLTSFFNNNLTVFYLGISNLFGEDNIVQVSYSPDYSEVYQQESTNKQSIYFGVSTNF